MGLNAALAGKVYDTFSYSVTAEGIRKYARATNDDNPVFHSDNPVAPPAYPFVAAAQLFDTVFGDPDLGVDVPMLVHAEQEHTFLVPIRAGDILQVRTTIEQVDLDDSGHNFTLAIALSNQNSQPAAEVRSTMFIRKTGTGAKAVEETAERGEIVAEGVSEVDEDQPARYAQASGDYNPIHLNREFARQAGFAGVVLHGMCTMAMAAKVVLDGVAGGDPDRLKRIKVQFSRPVFPGQTLITTVWRRPGGSGALQTYGFETVNARNAAVIRNGVAEVSGP